MKGAVKIGWLCAGLTVLMLSLHLLGCEAFAAKKTSNWRPTYDLIMRWINFGIIVFVVNKYAKGPLINFLRGRKEKVAKEIKTLEDKRDDTVAQIKETRKAVDESEIRFADLKERIVQQGEKKKEETIESARQQSRIMLDDAHRRVQSYILEARSKVKAELVDFAIDFAMQRLPQEITAADNEKFITEFMASSTLE
jgi:F-type H+-transporting ATPase subunit b